MPSVLDSSPGEGAPAPALADLLGRVGDLVKGLPEAIHRLLVEQVTELTADQQLRDLLSDTVAANVGTWLSVIRYSIPIDHVEAPTAALEHARRMAQREIPVNALLRAYRLGHQHGLNLIIAGLRSADLPPEQKLALFEQITSVSFRYIDWMSEQVLETYQVERAHWDDNRRSLREQAIRDILDGRDIDVTETSYSMRYPLSATHMALLVWLNQDASADSDQLIALERFARDAASAAGAEQLLYHSIDRLVACAWMTVPDPSSSLSQLRAFVQTCSESPRMAVGAPSRGLDGFRRTYRQAQQARAVAMAAQGTARRFVAAQDSGLALASMLVADVPTLKSWVHDVLGPLASSSTSDRRLRETLSMFLRAGGSFKAAAVDLHTHGNTVKYRVNRAVERRGRALADDRLDVEFALLMCDWFGDAVLT